jgi:hypothetical protein
VIFPPNPALDPPNPALDKDSASCRLALFIAVRPRRADPATLSSGWATAFDRCLLLVDSAGSGSVGAVVLGAVHR